MKRIRHAMMVLLAFWKLNWMEELQYRGNFFASVLSTVFWLVMAMLTVALYFGHTTQLGGWGYWDVVVLLGVFNALTGVVETVLRPGIGHLPADVRSGALDLVLVRPVDAQFYVSFRRLDVWRLADVVLGLGLSAYALAQTGRSVGAWQIVSFIVTFAVAIAVVYAIWVTLMSFAFWFVAVENMATLFDSVIDAARYPVSAYPGALRFLFVYLIPIAWTTTIPASALTGRLNPSLAMWSVAVGIAALGASRLLWRVALKRYTSAGG
ncbi:MAG: ABC-2 family transporter protein [Gemmatimonadaceae bacterium]